MNGKNLLDLIIVTDNPVRVITSLSKNCQYQLKKTLYPLADRLNSKIKETNNMLEIIDDINNSVLPENRVLVSFDVVNMFLNIDNKSGLLSVKEAN